MATTDKQRKASREWERKNRERSNYLSYRRTARSFIQKKATKEDLEELRGLIDEKLTSIE